MNRRHVSTSTGPEHQPVSRLRLRSLFRPLRVKPLFRNPIARSGHPPTPRPGWAWCPLPGHCQSPAPRVHRLRAGVLVRPFRANLNWNLNWSLSRCRRCSRAATLTVTRPSTKAPTKAPTMLNARFWGAFLSTGTESAQPSAHQSMTDGIWAAAWSTHPSPSIATVPSFPDLLPMMKVTSLGIPALS
jgi:hypothetical protein